MKKFNKKKEGNYNSKFYNSQKEGSINSAKRIAPLIMDLLNPKSVIDVGCGVGTWLKAFEDEGINDFLGIDGYWVKEKDLLIKESNFLKKDLKESFSINKKYDLVVSVEVAEHLPPEKAEGFIDSLTKLGNKVLFSAAIPYQGGENHLNEQWQSYWANLFIKKGFLPIDCIRKKIWKDDLIEYHYRQNIILYIKKETLEKDNKLSKEYDNTCLDYLDIVHPVRHLLTFKKIDILRKIIPSPLKKMINQRVSKEILNK